MAKETVDSDNLELDHNLDDDNEDDQDDEDGDDGDDGDDEDQGEEAEKDDAEACYDSDESVDPAPEVTGIPAREPRNKLANKMSFYKICEVLDYLSSEGGGGGGIKLPKKDKLNRLLPAPLLKKFAEKSERHPESLFPILRLLMQDKDSSRTFSTKEKSLATAYAGALGFEKESPKYIALHNFTDPTKLVGMHSNRDKVAGDFSLVVEKVLQGRISQTPSKATVGDINRHLDELSRNLNQARQSNKSGGGGNWSSTSQSFGQMSQSQAQQTQVQRKQKQKKKRGQRQVREDFVKKLTEELKLSPMEHKWVVRIILGESLKIGVGWEPIFDWCSPHARELWKSHNSLKAVCYKICDPKYIRQREFEKKQEAKRIKEQRFCQLYSFPANPDPIRINNTISAMKSDRTSFESFLDDISSRHVDVAQKKLPKDDPVRESLSLKFPAFSSEVKLDGERMLIHIKRGQVTLQTRQGKWYSPNYSPVIGPYVRKAIANYDVDVILGTCSIVAATLFKYALTEKMIILPPPPPPHPANKIL